MDLKLPQGCASRYRVEGLIAAGGFSSVYRAIQIDLARPVALKLLRPESLSDEVQVGRFRDEARMASRLSHPNIVKVLDHDVEDGIPWIAFELIDGCSVRERLDAGPLTVPEALAIARQVAAALGEAHALPLVHRDIKPENILLTADGTARITDFGIAKWACATVRTQSGVVLGTPPYISPEAIRGNPVGPPADVYGLGITLFEMIAGRTPFVGTAIAVLQAHINEPPPRLSSIVSGVSSELDMLIGRALAKAPEDRFATGAVMSAEIELCRAGGPATRPVARRTRNTRSTAALKRPTTRKEQATRATARRMAALGAQVQPPVAPAEASGHPSTVSGTHTRPRFPRMAAAVALGASVLLVGLLGGMLLSPVRPVPRASASPGTWPDELPPGRTRAAVIGQLEELARGVAEQGARASRDQARSLARRYARLALEPALDGPAMLDLPLDARVMDVFVGAVEQDVRILSDDLESCRLKVRRPDVPSPGGLLAVSVPSSDRIDDPPWPAQLPRDRLPALKDRASMLVELLPRLAETALSCRLPLRIQLALVRVALRATRIALRLGVTEPTDGLRERLARSSSRHPGHWPAALVVAELGPKVRGEKVPSLVAGFEDFLGRHARERHGGDRGSDRACVELAVRVAELLDARGEKGQAALGRCWHHLVGPPMCEPELLESLAIGHTESESRQIDDHPMLPVPSPPPRSGR